MAAEHLTDNNFSEAIASGVTLVDFFATWCGPCKMLSPVIEEIADECDGSFAVYKVDIDEAEDVAMDYGIMSVPTMIVFKNGAEAARMIGVRPKAEILDTVKKLVG
jgi:thioredoxin 1